MRISWCAIACINFLWCAYLWKHRRENHSWTLPFFAVYFVSDTSMLLASPSVLGGFNLMGPDRLGHELWIFVACVAWTSWFALPLLAACKLRYGRVPWQCWLPTVVSCLLLSASETLGLSYSARRFVMHVWYEPIILIISLVIIGRYVSHAISQGEEIDFLACAVALTCLMLLLKLGLMLDSVGLLRRWQAHTFHYLFMITLFGYYRWKKKHARRWLVFRS